jgi:hypothetical protein
MQALESKSRYARAVTARRSALSDFDTELTALTGDRDAVLAATDPTERTRLAGGLVADVEDASKRAHATRDRIAASLVLHRGWRVRKAAELAGVKWPRIYNTLNHTQVPRVVRAEEALGRYRDAATKLAELLTEARTLRADAVVALLETGVSQQQVADLARMDRVRVTQLARNLGNERRAEIREQTSTDRWAGHATDLRAFIEREGRWPRRAKDAPPEERTLANWLEKQTRRLRAGALTKEQAAILHGLVPDAAEDGAL